jgi:hypothetical protein
MPRAMRRDSPWPLVGDAAYAVHEARASSGYQLQFGDDPAPQGRARRSQLGRSPQMLCAALVPLRARRYWREIGSRSKTPTSANVEV